MPEFATPFSGLASERKLTRQELIRAIRFSMAAEFEAIQLYMQLAESIEDEIAERVLKDVADEERVHVGEFLRLLNYLAPDEVAHYAKGAREVEEMMAKASQGTSIENRLTEKDQSVPFCTSAPDPEHQRAHAEDEPCYDATEGDFEKG